MLIFGCADVWCSAFANVSLCVCVACHEYADFMGLDFSPHYFKDDRVHTERLCMLRWHVPPLLHLLLSPANTPLSLIHTHDPYLPPGKVQGRWMGRGIPLAVSPHPETCQPCRCRPAGIGHS